MLAATSSKKPTSVLSTERSASLPPTVFPIVKPTPTRASRPVISPGVAPEKVLSTGLM
ncbi:hypothetical protein D3C87_2054600 [compost metagenome]